MSEDDRFKLSLTGPGVSIERDLDEARALLVMQVVLGTSRSPLPGVVSSPAGPVHGAGTMLGHREQPLSLREFLEATTGRSIPTKIVGIGRYMRDHENQSDFSREDIKSRFRSAGEPSPGNFPRDFQNALRSGWIAEDLQNRGRYYVTRRGDEAIDSRFEGALPTVGRSRRRRRIEASGAVTEGEN